MQPPCIPAERCFFLQSPPQRLYFVHEPIDLCVGGVKVRRGAQTASRTVIAEELSSIQLGTDFVGTGKVHDDGATTLRL